MFGERARWLTILFAVSVLINLFLAGIVVGRLTFPGMPHPNRPGPGGLVTRRELRDLPLSERFTFADVMRKHMAEIKADHQRVLDARRAAEEAIGQPKYDRQLLETRFAAVRQTQLVLQTAANEAVIDALAALSPQSRAAIARRSEAELQPAP